MVESALKYLRIFSYIFIAKSTGLTRIAYYSVLAIALSYEASCEASRAISIPILFCHKPLTYFNVPPDGMDKIFFCLLRKCLSIILTGQSTTEFLPPCFRRKIKHLKRAGVEPSSSFPQMTIRNAKQLFFG